MDITVVFHYRSACIIDCCRIAESALVVQLCFHADILPCLLFGKRNFLQAVHLYQNAVVVPIQIRQRQFQILPANIACGKIRDNIHSQQCLLLLLDHVEAADTVIGFRRQRCTV